jgi:hypothetical protein
MMPLLNGDALTSLIDSIVRKLKSSSLSVCACENILNCLTVIMPKLSQLDANLLIDLIENLTKVSHNDFMLNQTYLKFTIHLWSHCYGKLSVKSLNSLLEAMKNSGLITVNGLTNISLLAQVIYPWLAQITILSLQKMANMTTVDDTNLVVKRN